MGCHNSVAGTNMTAANSFMNTRGPIVFGYGIHNTFASVLDGLSNTIFIGECGISDYSGTTNIPIQGGVALTSGGLTIAMYNGTGISNCLGASGPNGLYRAVDVTAEAATNNNIRGCGRRWCDGNVGMTAFAVAVPPNGPSCCPSTTTSEMVINAANSYHSGGVNVCKGDGAVAFVSDSINSLTPGLTAYNFPKYGASDESSWGVWGAMGTIACGESAAP
jgi:prepilin-type processing-associated H-X9-DG protein